jgi:thiamine phosphate synthase YjbQ (UPF0047 family)
MTQSDARARSRSDFSERVDRLIAEAATYTHNKKQTQGVNSHVVNGIGKTFHFVWRNTFFRMSKQNMAFGQEFL